MSQPLRTGHGPFLADQIREGDRYELSHGHPIEVAPAGGDHAASNVGGAEVLDSDPEVEWSGIDPGISHEPGTLRAPDVAVGKKPAGEGSGWISEAPPLAVEYASKGQDEAKLQEKIADLLEAGTRHIWVVRLVGPRRVEVYEPGKPVRTAGVGDDLTAPGVLRNPVPVLALFDREAAHEVTLRNLLQRRGYDSPEAIRAEGRAEGEAEGKAEGQVSEAAQSLLSLLETRDLPVSAAVRDKILACRDLPLLRRWLVRGVSAKAAEEIFGES